MESGQPIEAAEREVQGKHEVIADACRDAFHLENERATKLEHKAERIFGAAAVVLGYEVVSLDPDTSVAASPCIPESLIHALLAISYLALAAALSLAAHSVLVRRYVGYPRRLELTEELGKEGIPLERARAMLALLFLNAREENAVINDARARKVHLAGWLLLAAIVGGAIAHILTSPT